jgi:hypothetical protein
MRKKSGGELMKDRFDGGDNHGGDEDDGLDVVWQ